MLDAFDKEVKRLGDKWPYFQSGFFGKSPERYEAAMTKINNNLTGTFSLNNMQFDVTSSVFGLSGNPLDFKADGATNPILKQNSAAAITISNNLILVDKVKPECEQLARLEKAAKANGPAIQAEIAAFQKSSEIKAFDAQYNDAVMLK